jgi:type IV pilus assembly protein PilV
MSSVRYVLHQRGVTLIEVLVALLIFSIGMLGVAGLLMMAARSVHGAYLRTQVTFLAQGMADRMSANLVGVWKGYYNGAYPAPGTQSCAGGCTPQQLAEHDKVRWSSQLDTFLPAGSQAEIHCRQTGVAYAPTADQLALRPSYGGSCSMTVTWPERAAGSDTRRDGAQPTQTFAWEFQP